VIIVVVSPIQTALIRRGAPQWVALVALLVASFGILFTIIASLIWSTSELIGLLTSDDYVAKLDSTQTDIRESLEDLGVGVGANSESTSGIDLGAEVQDAIDGIDVASVLGNVVSALSGVLGVTSAIGLLILTMLFMVLDAERFEDNLKSVSSDRPDVVSALYGFADRTRSYFVVSTVFGLIVAGLDVIALMILGIPLALVWGVLSLITNYVPNIGFVIGLIPPALLALFEGGWKLSLWVSLIYLAINIIVQTIIQPKVVGDAVGLSATLTFVSLIFWGWVLGPLGALLAVPMTLLAKALLVDIDPATRWAAPLIALNEARPTESTGQTPDVGSDDPSHYLSPNAEAGHDDSSDS